MGYMVAVGRRRAHAHNPRTHVGTYRTQRVSSAKPGTAAAEELTEEESRVAAAATAAIATATAAAVVVL